MSKRLGSAYRGGRVDYWLKIKNPAAPAVKRAAGWGLSKVPAADAIDVGADGGITELF